MSSAVDLDGLHDTDDGVILAPHNAVVARGSAGAR